VYYYRCLVGVGLRVIHLCSTESLSYLSPELVVHFDAHIVELRGWKRGTSPLGSVLVINGVVVSIATSFRG
jgi:hypothetical protein